jgi:hydroxymethylpyrimidine/phosphomethylpyrimidine kinase
MPCAVTIAGSDSGGGAGTQADLKTFHALGVHGASVLTCVTAQNPRRVLGIEPCGCAIVSSQLRAVFSELQPAAAKTGMLHSSAGIGVVARFLRRRSMPLVVDPVMVSTSGAALLEPAAVRALTSELLPLATILTPNLSEAEALLEARLRTPQDLRDAARGLHQRFGCAVLMKGGHLRGLNEAVDIFYDGKQELLLSAPFLRGVDTHGTGCTYSAAITAWLARGARLAQAVSRGKQFITQAIANSRRTGRHTVLGW